ncbi:MAG: cytochrome C oxidase subunit III [Gemmatimonadetes bacterium]|nr:MAG: cytochrome C oxidase subunit III [Gemmatimonadota bacterium]
MSKDTNRLLGHADEADGIDEYDNPLPDWWLGLFWVTILFAIVYSVHYHVIADRSIEADLAREMAAAEARWPDAAETPEAAAVEFAITPEAVAAGEQVFQTNCASCHGADLTGGIGPNLIDDEWIHGGTPEDVIRTITEGVPEKGMLTWGPLLSAEQIRDVAAYVLSKSQTAGG